MTKRLFFLGISLITLLCGCGQETFDAFDKWHITDPTERGLVIVAIAIFIHAIFTGK